MFQNANLFHLIDGIPHAAVLVDTGLSVRRLNRRAEALTGRSDSEASGIRVENVLRSNLNPFERYFGKVLERKQIEVIEGNVLDQNRKIIPVRVSVSPVEGQDNVLLGAMVVLEDLSYIPQLSDGITGDGFEEMVSLNPTMQDIYDQIPVFAGTDAPVLIEGETGTGKGFVAELIHKASKRAGFPFIKVNCGALPEQLLESELFGHVSGAFPGADRDKPGMFRLADRGTIFFTEIGDLPLALQAKLLTVLDDGVFISLGSTKKVAMNVRIIAASGKELKALISEGRFREDLFYRLKVLQLRLPSLRERSEDVPLLVDQFIRHVSAGNLVPGIDEEALRLLKDYSYPGNVRELRNIVEFAVTLCHGETIKSKHLPEYLLQEQRPDLFPGRAAARHAGPLRAAGETPEKSMKWDDVEKEMIMEALRKSRGKRSEAAKMLGWARSTLYRKLKYHDI